MRAEVTVTAESLALTAAVTLASTDPVTGVSLFGLAVPFVAAVVEVELVVGLVVAAFDRAAPVPMRPAVATRAATPVRMRLLAMMTPWVTCSVGVDR